MRAISKKENGGVGGTILYISIIAIVGMISLAVVLDLFLFMPPPKSNLDVKYYINGNEVQRIVCTITDHTGNAYYDSVNNSPMLSILVEKNNAPQPNVWVSISGCGITSDSEKTDAHGFAHFNIKSVYLPNGLSRDNIHVSVMGHKFNLEVVRG